MSTAQNPRNSFVIDALPGDDPELAELEHLKKLRSQIQKKRKNAKQRNFDAKHPTIKQARDAMFAAQAHPGLKPGEKIPVDIAVKESKEIVHTERSEPKPVESEVKAPVPETKPQFELGGQPLKTSAPSTAPAPSIFRPVNNKWF